MSDRAAYLLRTVFAELDEADGQAPGHSHAAPGVWDRDNGPPLAGTPCKWCETWAAVRRLVAHEDPTL